MSTCVIYGYGYVFNCDLGDGWIDGIGWLVSGYFGGYLGWTGPLGVA